MFLLSGGVQLQIPSVPQDSLFPPPSPQGGRTSLLKMFSAKENNKETIISAQGVGTNMSKCFRQKRITKRQLSQDGPCTPGSELRWDSPGSDACRLHSINAACAHHLHHPSLHNHPNHHYILMKSPP